MDKAELLKQAKPILFNTEMVRAILDGRKTQTRRVAKPQRDPYEIDDILYVRETWNKGYIEISDAECSNECWFEEINKYDNEYFQAIAKYFYRSDYLDGECNLLGFTWKPSIHMPKEAARIFLRVTGVRIERLQDIDDVGVVAEGMNIGDPFDDLWNSTIKKKDLPLYGWKANPWVWVYEFERIEVEEK
ncbi:MAG: hypothetical protein NC122_06210 [Faecalibacterium sp.]|nr:hypothetical protein [Ruminococcus sp.]MCM1392087.1 hypothetical protein [Ruminococcus sp.]MCM1485784.1 hypothetical protein [Faecalibacterium sp.]